MLAIADSLDEKVDESKYQRDEIRRVFSLIQKDTISPEERAKMIEEYHLEEGKRTAFSEGLEEGLEKGIKSEKINTALSLLQVGMDIAMICQVTKLTLAEVRSLQNK